MSVRRVAWAYGASLLGVFSSLLTNLWVVKAVAVEASKEELGLLFSFVTFLGYLMTLQTGLDLVVSQRVAEGLAKGDPTAARRTYRQMVWYNRALAGWVAVMTAGVAAVVTVVPVADGVDPALAPRFAGLIGAGLAAYALSMPSASALAGGQFAHVLNLTRVGANVAVVFLAFGLLRAGAGIYCLPLAQAVAQFAALAVLDRFRRAYCPWADGPVGEPWAGFGSLVRYAVTIGGVTGFNAIEAGCEPFVFGVSSADPLPNTATYSLWLRFPGLLIGLGCMLIVNALPTLAGTLASDFGRGVGQYRKVYATAWAIALAAAVGCGAWLPPFVHHWLDGQYDVPDAPRVSAAFAALIVGRILLSTMTQVLYLFGAARVVLIGSAVTAVVKVALGLLLVRWAPVFGMVTAWAVAVAIAAVAYAAVLYRLRALPLHWLAASATLGCGIAPLVLVVAPATESAGLNTLALGVTGTLVACGGAGVLAARRMGYWPMRLSARKANPAAEPADVAPPN